MDEKTWSRCYTGLIVVIVGLGCYLNTLNSDFVYDDSRAIQNNTDLRSTTPWVNLLYNDFWGTPLTHSGSHKSYRPLCVASFRLNYAINGLNPAGYHAINAVLHSIVCLLVVVLCYAMVLSHHASLIAGLLFATHPIHTEAVAGIVGRADIGACLFFIAALLSYMSACPYYDTRLENISEPKKTNWKWLLVSLLFSAASMLTKEQGITVLGVCVVFEFIAVSRINSQCFKASLRKAISGGLVPRVLCLIITSLCLLSLRFILMGNTTPDFSNSDNPAANSDSFQTRALTFLYLPAFNFWLLLCPRTLSFDWSMDAIPLVQSIFDWRNSLSIIFYSCLFALGISALRRVNLVLRNASTLSEHGLKDPKAHTTAVHKIKYNLGRILADKGNLKDAFEVYHDAVRTLPSHVEPHSLYNMVGEAYNKAGMPEQAEKWYKMSIQSKPDHVPAHLTLAKHYGKTNRVQEALNLFRRAQQLQPNDYSVWTHFGQFLYERRNIASAAEMFVKASYLKRDDFDIVFTAANYLREAGQKEKSREYFTKAARIDPQNPIAHMNLGAIHHVLGDYEQGEKSYLMALKLKPGDEMTQENLKKLRALKTKKSKKTK
ncbi:protein O-mannosyl-transferase TMTC2 [Exaiptasia diaphana]|uniref:dolichyl-phosphate-mannose--protein mannosyltransferase n=1 Tax=Exaiptasia diaphana TaxID=2652724 RepID=A0A913YTB1_EXADI|nr:protein O-mannosyl-transferase TMTC2 [Exaiptasia diaphana]